MKRHLLIFWRLGPVDGWWAALKYLVGLYPLAQWEKSLLTLPKRKEQNW